MYYWYLHIFNTLFNGDFRKVKQLDKVVALKLGFKSLFPVTGQTLPLISSGGTSIWMTCIAVGIILSVTVNKEKTDSEINDDNPLNVLHETIG